jgi:hypothetical protein
MRRWIENWREVNEAQDDLVRSEPTPDAAASLEAGLSLIAFAGSIRERHPQIEAEREVDEESVRCTWRRLRAAHVP